MHGKSDLVSGALNSVQSAHNREPVMELAVPARTSLLHWGIKVHDLILDTNFVHQDFEHRLDFIGLEGSTHAFSIADRLSALLALAMGNNLSNVSSTFLEVTALILDHPSIDGLLQSTDKQCLHPDIQLSNPLIKIRV